MYVVSKPELELAKLCASKNANYQPSLAGILISADETRVTDGTLAVIAKVQRYPIGDYPTLTPAISNGVDGPVRLQSDAALSMAKSIKRGQIPIVECAIVGTDGQTVTAAVAKLPGDSRTAHAAETLAYPNLDKVIPTGEAKATIAFDPDKMIALMQAAKRFGVRCVQLQIHSDDLAMVIRSKGDVELTMVLMPMRY